MDPLQEQTMVCTLHWSPTPLFHWQPKDVQNTHTFRWACESEAGDKHWVDTDSLPRLSVLDTRIEQFTAAIDFCHRFECTYLYIKKLFKEGPIILPEIKTIK